VCCLFDDEAAKIERSDENKGRFVLWLLYDWYLQQLECDCWSCKPDEGVPLARVYLARSDEPGGGCHVIFIDHSPSHRRTLSRDDCLIVPDGWLDLRRFHWQPVESARAALDRYDIDIIKDVSARDALDKFMPKSVLFMAPGKRVQGYAFADPSGLRRLLGFYEA
jgi:hypothetical protein